MRTITAGLEAHLALSTTSIATLWKVVRVDGQTFGFTDHDKDLVVSGVAYLAATGYTRSAVRATLGLQPDNLEIEGLLDSSAIEASDIRAGIWDYASVEIMLVNWSDLSQGTLGLGKGRIGQIRDGRSVFVAELLGLSKHLMQVVGRLYMPACDADLGDTRCGVTLASYTVTGTLTSVTNNRTFADTSRGEADGYFDGGKITWTSGDNNGLSMEVKTSLLAGGAVTLQMPMPFTVIVGNTYSMSAGCDKTFATCGTKFNNKVNFQGFPHVPGNRRMISGGL